MNGFSNSLAMERFSQALADEMARITAICEAFGFQCEPTLVLRHKDGANKSALISNDDDSAALIKCITELCTNANSKVRVVATDRLVVE